MDGRASTIMGDKKSEISFEGTMSLEEVLSYLEDFTASVRGGTVRVEAGDEQVVLTPAEVVKLAVKAKAKNHKQSFRLELSWEDGGLKIGS
jgi:amphi-Trp domain-containing protein